ncbi:ATP-binding protein [Spirillospora sp. CA-142024]|uniref:ATP-binding protein n=1 Tax=Spirillospora sp. CA-142024 TaxID=3240036 RepID=UPI003D90DFDD
MREILDEERFPPFRKLFFALEQARPEFAGTVTRLKLAELNHPEADVAGVLARELMRNAYQHTTGANLAELDGELPRTVRLEVGMVDVPGCAEARVRVAVFDQGDLFGFSPANVRRGLMLAQALGDRYGYGCDRVRRPDGKVVWVQF